MKNLFKNLLIATSLTGFFPTLAAVYLTHGLTAFSISAVYIAVLMLAIKVN